MVKYMIDEWYLISGNPPVDASHVYRFKMYVYDFLHPFSNLRNNTGGTVPTPNSCEPIAESLHGLFHLKGQLIFSSFELTVWTSFFDHMLSVVPLSNCRKIFYFLSFVVVVVCVINFSQFHLPLQNNWTNFNETWCKHC